MRSLIDFEGGTGLSLMPLIFWYPCPNHRDIENGHCFLFDKLTEDRENLSARFKASGFACRLDVNSSDSELADLISVLGKFRIQDPCIEPLNNFKLAHALA